MALVLRIARYLVVLLVVVVAAAVGFVGAITIRSLPQTDGRLTIEALDALVSVHRDANGIVNIYGDSPHDLFFTQGYVHAQERLWQMEVWRHISAGRLSELFGPSTLDQDRFIRTLGWRQAAERDLAALSPDARAALDAYADGVNEFIDTRGESLGLAFVVTAVRSGAGGPLGYELEPWTALDSLAWQKVQSWQLGGDFEAEVFRLLADAELGDPARTDVLFPAYRPEMPVITPTGLPGSGGAGAPGAAAAAGAAATASPPAGTASPSSATATAAMPSLKLSADDADAFRDVATLGGTVLASAGLDAGAGLAADQQVGSNNWVVAPGNSETGTALIANDPHLGIGMPSVWFINGLHCRTISETCPYDVAGVSFPGVPGIVLGHNARIAWGATNADPDVQDLFVEEIDPANPDNYLFAGESVPFTTRTELIEVAGGADVIMTVRETRHGPLLNDVDPRLADAPLLALRWTATADVDGTFEAVHRLNTASTFDEFRAALATYGSPSQNFVYADVDGHIGYVLPGRIPIRADPADLGSRARSGSDGAHEWTGYIPFEDLPWQLDPDVGMIVTANNAAVDASYPHFISADWDPGYRAARILELLQDAADEDGATPRILREIQMDVRVPRSDLVRPSLEAAAPATDDGRRVADLIRDWDGRADVDSTGAAAYLVTEYELLRGLFDDDLGDLAREYVGGGQSWEALIALLDDPASAWWDDTTTPDRLETQPDILAGALDRAGAGLRKLLGDPAGWTWGRLHVATFREQTLGTSGIGPLEWYFNKGPQPVGGASGAIDNTYYRPDRAYPDPNDPDYVPVGLGGVFEVTNLPSYRLVLDMGDPDGAMIVQTTGQSGNPFDSHYGDMIDEWASGTLVPFPFTEAAVSEATVKKLELDP
ncbi:MAG TPA: penicillin acylase family protein [Candidatus Limnocylindrales bacterium]|nr:penicillin acylase family protein [Candidatus Limnocylindrales bacterium]